MTKRNPTLDVWRALAIVAVVQCHAATAYLALTDSSRAELPLLRVLQLGGHGVDLFFVLSGWLLGSILCREFAEQGTIDVRRFWLRRWLRTLPAYYAVLLLTYLQAFIAHRSIDLRYLVFLQNYEADAPYFRVSWSLCVEEHFYLLIGPLLLLILPKRRVSMAILTLLLLVPLICRRWGWYQSLENTHVRFDQCAAGVTLAYVATFWPSAWQRLQQVLPFLLAMGLVMLAANVVFRVYDRPDLPLGAFTFIFATWIAWSQRNAFWSERLHIPLARFIADRAYSLYLLHVEALALMKYLPAMSFWLYVSAVWVVSLALAEVLYRVVELPGMRSREWLQSAKSRVSK